MYTSIIVNAYNWDALCVSKEGLGFLIHADVVQDTQDYQAVVLIG